jgi:cytochrome c556
VIVCAYPNLIVWGCEAPLKQGEFNMKRVFVSAIVAAGLVASASTAFSGEAEDKAVKARQSLMQLFSFNLGQLGAMVKGDMPYDEAKAKAAAMNLQAAANMDQSAMWPAGTSLEEAGMEGKTWAKKAAWDTFPEVANKHKALVEASAKMADAAGGGVDAIKGAIGGVGGSCKGCHENFRAPKK